MIIVKNYLLIKFNLKEKDNQFAYDFFLIKPPLIA